MLPGDMDNRTDLPIIEDSFDAGYTSASTGQKRHRSADDDVNQLGEVPPAKRNGGSRTTQEISEGLNDAKALQHGNTDEFTATPAMSEGHPMIEQDFSANMNTTDEEGTSHSEDSQSTDDEPDKEIDLDVEISCIREALLNEEEGGDQPWILLDLASALLERSRRCNSKVDMEEAIGHLRSIISLRPEGDPEHPVFLAHLANALAGRYKEQGHRHDLEESIELHRKALVLCGNDHPARASSLSDLGVSLTMKFEQFGGLQDLDEAIEHHQEALSLRPIGHLERFISLNNLSTSLTTRFELLGSVHDLEKGIQFDQEALPLCSQNDPRSATSCSNLAVSLCHLFELKGVLQDLEEAILHLRASLKLRSRADPGYPLTKSNLAIALTHRFDYLGDLADLEEAVIHERDALDSRDQGHPNRSISLSNLAGSLFVLFEQREELRYLEEALVHQREALQLRPDGHPGRPLTLSNLALLLITRYETFKQSGDLDEGLAYEQAALALMPVGSPNRHISLRNLAAIYSDQFKRRGLLEDLEESIKYNRSALLLRPPGHPSRYELLHNLAQSLQNRFKAQRIIGDLEEAITCCQEAQKLLPVGHPTTARVAALLASAYLDHNTSSGENPRVDEAFDLFRTAVNHPGSGVNYRFDIGLKWIDYAQSHQHSSLLDAYQSCLELLDRYITFSSSITSRRHVMSSTRIPHSLATNAAACAIDAGQIDLAVELLEQGRTVIWSQLARYRPTLDQLRELDEGLATKFATLSRQLESTTISTPRGAVSHRSLDNQARTYRLLSEKWDGVVRDIRKLNGFGTFLTSTSYITLKQASANGPVIILNVSQLRCDAIIITVTGDPLLVPLPDVRAGDIDQLPSLFSSALETMEVKTRRSKILSILRDLWSCIVEPVVKALEGSGVKPGSRIWWCPTGKLTFLPLHAAGPHERGIPDLPDLFTSSYAPTLSALLKCYSPNNSHKTTSNLKIPRLLIVAQPSAPEQREIACVRDELARISRHAPQCEMLLDENGTRDAVLHKLPSYPWVHFASHGSQDLGDPFQSCFHLIDGPLALLDIIRAPLSEAEFAFLSACHTAAGDHATPDEAIHLAAGLQFSGFKSVIGTLYAMADVDGPVMAEEVYKYMFRQVIQAGDKPDSELLVDYKDAAKALNIATKILKQNGVPPERWINFIHIGA